MHNIVTTEIQELASAVEGGKHIYETLQFWVPVSVFLFIFSVTVSILYWKNIQLRRRLKEHCHESCQTAHQDFLTKLPNRRYCSERLKDLTEIKSEFSIIFIDLDRFKYINDTFGHTFGDKLLVSVAERLKSAVREEEIVCRIGGDEFIIILDDITDEKTITMILERVLEKMSSPFQIEALEFKISPSMGVAICPKDASDANQLMTFADLAMYKAKGTGRNSYFFYTPFLSEENLELVTIEQELRFVVESNQLELFLQPQIDIKKCEIVGAEVLLRWNHPIHGIISPMKFIPIAEDTGLIVPIGEWVIDQACKFQRRLQDMGVHLRVGINISPYQFTKGNLFETVTKKVEEYKLEPTNLELELTESLLLSNEESIKKIFNSFDNFGVSMSIDDFGVGYSNFGYIKKFPVDRIKIDRMFVSDIETDESDRTLIKSIIKMAHEMDLQVIAEGVETKEQLDFLRTFDCDEVQGYYFTRPVPFDYFINYYHQFESNHQCQEK